MEEHDYDSNSNPPLMSTYKHLFVEQHRLDMDMGAIDVDECELPVIDLAGLMEAEQVCRADMVRAASEWGFFQVTNHGVPQALLRELHDAQVAVFRRPFQEKVTERLLGFSPESYRWGTPTAKCLEQLSWSEAYHIPMTTPRPSTSIRARAVIEEVSRAMYELAQKLAEILMRGLPGAGEGETMVTTREETCFLRLNRYPPCAMAMGGFGLCPHTDSDLLTIVHQQQGTVGGLQLLKGGRWVAVKPSPSTLIVNVGDLLQAWSNDVYKSVEHRVMANATLERFSMAFFLCPSYHTLIIPSSSHVHDDDAHYRSFTFGEYRKQIMEDVRSTGRKIGLHRFRTR
uniref:gibberellin 2beta-dioxygenase n=1 Tax=Oryza rufipogon TaxID=4529 RepID=A0A0E0Q350_ORYRU